MPNFSIALTGLQADTVSLDTIGNNLANLNTTAFKKQSNTFQDLLYQNVGTSGSGDTLQIGVGVRASATASDFSQGSINTTDVSTDVALNGAGFFLVQRGQVQSLTRAGDFQLDSSGNLITNDGESVMGYGVKNGAVNLNAGLIPLALPIGASEAAQATANVTLSTSLDASAPVSTMTNPTTFPTSIQVYDSLGTAHTLSVVYTKTSATQWTYSLSLPSTDYTGTASSNTTGTLTFNSNGMLTSPTGNVTAVTFPGLKDGASDLAFNFDLYNSAGTPVVTQTTGTSNVAASKQDGFAGGAYQTFSVDGTGTISAQFSNGQITRVGQIAIATVVNSDGLTRAGQNDFSATDASGAISVGVANAGGRGALEGDALEASNVDISGEFSNLIIAQRAFEANSKTVTTFDSVTQEAINMIR